MSSIVLMSWWIWSRSNGVMKVLKQRHGLVRDLVGRALGGVDARGVGVELGESPDHRGELAAALDDALGVGVEQVEELPLAGHQASEHPRFPSLFYLWPRPADLSLST